MKIIYNPQDGAPINRFIFKGVMLDLHPVGELRQYDDLTADALLETYGFLELVTKEQATELLSKPKDPQYPCEFCEKKFHAAIALSGHMRTHKKEIAAQGDPEIDPELIPVAGGKKVISKQVTDQMAKDYVLKGDIPNGTDADGVDWYGEGLTEDKGSFAKLNPIGTRGHFGGSA